MVTHCARWFSPTAPSLANERLDFVCDVTRYLATSFAISKNSGGGGGKTQLHLGVVVTIYRTIKTNDYSQRSERLLVNTLDVNGSQEGGAGGPVTRRFPQLGTPREVTSRRTANQNRNCDS